MPVIIGKMFFNDLKGRNGWTEKVHMAVAQDLTQAGVDLGELMQARIKLLGNGVKLEYASVSVDDNKLLGDVLVPPVPKFSVSDDMSYNKDLVISGLADMAWTCMLVRLRTAGGLYARNYYLGGIPDKLTVNGQGAIDDPVWNKYFDKWIEVITSGRFGIKSWSKDQGTSPCFDLKGVLNANPGGVVSKAATGFAEGDLVFVHGVKANLKEGPKGPHGEFSVKSVDGLNVALNNCSTAGVAYISGGYIRKRVPVMTPIIDFTKRGLIKKSRGGPLFHTRGRSTRKKS